MTEFIVKDSGKRQEYSTGMVRDVQDDKPDYTLIDRTFLKRLAWHLTKGAKKYGRRNWELAATEEELDRFKASALRHMMQWLDGEDDEDHMAAVAFNLAAAEMVKRKLMSNSGKTTWVKRDFSKESIEWRKDFNRVSQGYRCIECGSLKRERSIRDTVYDRWCPNPECVLYVEEPHV